MSDYDPDRVLQVACPSCGAQAGKRCVARRTRRDFHPARKSVIYPEFSSKRSGLPDRSRKANAIVDAIDGYIDAELALRGSEHRHGYEKRADARDKLVEAIKDGLSLCSIGTKEMKGANGE